LVLSLFRVHADVASERPAPVHAVVFCDVEIAESIIYRLLLLLLLRCQQQKMRRAERTTLQTPPPLIARLKALVASPALNATQPRQLSAAARVEWHRSRRPAAPHNCAAFAMHTTTFDELTGRAHVPAAALPGEIIYTSSTQTRQDWRRKENRRCCPFCAFGRDLQT